MSQHTTFVDDGDGSTLEVDTTLTAVRVTASDTDGEPIMVDLSIEDAEAFARAVRAASGRLQNG